MGKIESNIWKLYLIRAIRWFLIIMPIIVLFFQENGLSMKEIMIIQAGFSLTVVLFEIPSGYLADIIGRKKSIIIGLFLGVIGFGMYSVSGSFWMFFISEIVLGIGGGFISGADDALVYDSLLNAKKEKDFKKVEGRFLSLGHFSEGISAIIGGFLAVISLRFPFYIQTAILFLTIPVAFSLIEPKRKVMSAKTGNWNNILSIVKFSIKEHKELKWLIIYSSILGAGTLTMVWFIQPYLQLVGLPLALFGIAWAAYQFSVTIFALQADRVEKFLGRKKALILLLFLIVACFALLSIFQYIWAIVFIFLSYMVRSWNGPIIKDYINKIITSERRATVLSIGNMVARLIFVIVGPFAGWITDLYSIGTALMMVAGIILFFGLITLFSLHKHKAL